MVGKRFFRLLHNVHRRFRQIIERRLRQSLVIEHKGDDSEGNRAVHNGERKHLKALAKADLTLAAMQPAPLQRRIHQRLLRTHDRRPHSRKRRFF